MIQSSTSAALSSAATTTENAANGASKLDKGGAPASPSIGQKLLRGTTVALAIAIGATGGTFSALGFLQYAQLTQVTEAAPMPTLVDETRAMWSAVTQLQNDMAVLKSNTVSTPSSTGNSNAIGNGATGQLSNLTERFDRIERRIDALVAKETTGSVPTTAPVQALAPQRGGTSGQSALSGWSVRDVYRNAALIQGTRFGMIEVSPGDNIPGLGRVHSIRQQDGRWVVVTSRGIITSPR